MDQATPAKLAALRQTMQQHGIAACLIPSADPHLSEYLPEHWQARAWLCGFTGSAGTLVVTADHAGLWTDSRYFAQATQQLAGTGVELMKQRVAHAPEHIEWLQQHLQPGQTLAVATSKVPAPSCAWTWTCPA
jgi:Xaa-Pro aminopeptidase